MSSNELKAASAGSPKVVGDENICAVCSIPANFRCAGCRIIFYCCKDHQASHWKMHKQNCAHKSKKKPQNADPSAEGAASLPSASAWSRGFPSPDNMYEWFVDCYRMRVDDDYAWNGGELRGIYNTEGTKDTVVADLLVFAKLSVKNGVVPQGWDWGKFLKAALPLVTYAFEKSDAQEKYGGENVFSVFTSGKPSLRYVAEVVYGSSCQSFDFTNYSDMLDIVMVAFERKNPFTEQSQALFQDVGGMEIWKNFRTKLKLIRL